MAQKTLKPQYYCVGCGRHRDKKEFNLNYNKYLQEYNDNRMLYCISCCKTISQKIMADYENFEMGMRNVATFFCMPIVEEAIIKLKDLYEARNKDVDWNWVTQYGACLKDLEVDKEKWDNLTGNSLCFDPTFRQLDRDNFESLRELVKTWGDRTLFEYEFLESRWQKYTDGLKLTTAQASLYRQICVQELDIRNKEKAKEPVKESQGEVMKLMNKLGIDKFVSNDKSLLERGYEHQVEYIEREEPAFHYKDMEMFKDYRGIGEYFENHITRPFKNLLLNSKDYKILDEFLNTKKKRTKE